LFTVRYRRVACQGGRLGWIPAYSFGGGPGTYMSPYQIATAGQLTYLAYLENTGINTINKYYVLTADIDLSGKQWTQIGLQYFFAGSFYGQGHIVKCLTIGTAASPYISTTASFAGLFGNSGRVGIENASIYTGDGTSLSVRGTSDHRHYSGRRSDIGLSTCIVYYRSFQKQVT
jgi:hypothetical protein